MIYYNNQLKATEEAEINKLVGFPYGFIERLKLGGIGSPRLIVHSFSHQLEDKFGKNADRKTLNIELREKGIIVYFRNHINNYLWPIPYYRLALYQDGTFNIHAEGMVIRINLEDIKPSAPKFLKLLMNRRASYLEDYTHLP